MAMNKDTLGAAIWTALKATQTYSPALTVPQDAAGLLVWTKVADEIIKHVIANAVVSPGSMAITPANIVAPLGGGPCTGTGTVTTGTGTVSS